MSFVSSAIYSGIFMSINEAKDLKRACMAGRGQDPSSPFSVPPNPKASFLLFEIHKLP